MHSCSGEHSSQPSTGMPTFSPVVPEPLSAPVDPVDVAALVLPEPPEPSPAVVPPSLPVLPGAVEVLGVPVDESPGPSCPVSSVVPSSPQPTVTASDRASVARVSPSHPLSQMSCKAMPRW